MLVCRAVGSLDMHIPYLSVKNHKEQGSNGRQRPARVLKGCRSHGRSSRSGPSVEMREGCLMRKTRAGEEGVELAQATIRNADCFRSFNW